MTSIRAPNRGRSSSTLACPVPSLSSYSLPSSSPSITIAGVTTTFSSTKPLTVSSQGNGGIIHIPSTTSATTALSSSNHIAVATARASKLRRPSLPIMSPSLSYIPTQKSFAHLQHTRDTSSSLRSTSSTPRPNAAATNSDRNEHSLVAPSNIARPASALSSRSYSSSSPSALASSPRLGSSSRFGDHHHPRPVSSLCLTGTNTHSMIAKPVSRPQKSNAIKPPSIVTKPSSTSQSQAQTQGQSSSITSSSSASSTISSAQKSSASSMPPLAPSPSSLSAQTPQTASSSGTLSSISPLSGSLGIPALSGSGSPTGQNTNTTASITITTSNSTMARSKNRLRAGIDSACFMTRCGSSESFVTSSTSSSASSTPTTTAVSTMAPLKGTSTISEASIPETRLSTAIPSSQRKIISRRPSAADLRATTPSFSSSSIPPPSISTSISTSGDTISAPSASSPLKNNVFAAEDRMEILDTHQETTISPLDNSATSTTAVAVALATKTSSTTTASSQCQCATPLEFPENVKREMKNQEEEHRERECGLYSKIIELQIECANLKGEKETLNKRLSHREKMLMELRVQLQAMEFVCRENDIKVDIEMCPDEAIENWSFKESDEVYQRILLTTQDLLRSGSKCLEENKSTLMSRTSSSHHQHHHNHQQYQNQQHYSSRSTRSSSITTTKMSPDHHHFLQQQQQQVRGLTKVAGLSEDEQPLAIQKQEVDSLLFKETSRPGTLKFDIHSLLKSEQEFNTTTSNYTIGNNKSTVSHQNLADIDAGMVRERDGRRAIDCGDDRSNLFRIGNEEKEREFRNDFTSDHDNNSNDADADYDEDDDEGQESEFEELGEDMIKYVELQSSVGPPRRESRSSSFSKVMTPSLIGTPDMSTAVLMKNLWSSTTGRRSTATTPLQHPFHQYQHQQQQQQQQCSHGVHQENRSSGGSTISNGSLLEDYFARAQHPMDGPASHANGHHAAPIGLGLGVGLGMTGLGRSPELSSMERFLSAPPTRALPSPPALTASHHPHHPHPLHPHHGHPHHQPQHPQQQQQQQYFMRSPLSTSSATFSQGVVMENSLSFNSNYNSYGNRSSNASMISVPSQAPPPPMPQAPPPSLPPMMPLPPLPPYPRYSYREHTKQKLLEFKRPSHGRTSSHGFVIENVGQFLKRKTVGKTLTRDWMHRGHRRRDSV